MGERMVSTLRLQSSFSLSSTVGRDLDSVSRAFYQAAMCLGLSKYLRTNHASVGSTLCTAAGREHCDRSYHNQGCFSRVIRRPGNHRFRSNN